MNIRCPPNTLGKFSQVVNVCCLQPWDDSQNFLCIVVFGKSSKGSCVSHGPFAPPKRKGTIKPL
jgi:hypothetical protein